MVKQEELLKLVLKKYVYIDPSDISFSEYSPVYIGTNENQRGVIHTLDVYGKDILCILGGGDFALNALAMDAVSVTTFDKNILSPLILTLKIAAILTFPNPDDFKAFFTFGDYFLSPILFEKIKVNLPTIEQHIWEFIYRRAIKLYGDFEPLYQSNFIRHEMSQTSSIQSKYNIYYDNYYYRYLRKRLETEKIDFYPLGIENLGKIIEKISFNLIYLSNVLQYYQTIDFLSDVNKVHLYIEYLKHMLKPEGIIAVCYGYFGYDLRENTADIRTCLLEDYKESYEELKFPSFMPPGEKDSVIITKK